MDTIYEQGIEFDKIQFMEKQRERLEGIKHANTLYNHVINEGCFVEKIDEEHKLYTKMIRMPITGIWSKIKKLVKNDSVTEEETIKEISAEYTRDNGREKIAELKINQDNQLQVYEHDNVRKDCYGYKAAKTPLGKNCIIKLYIPEGAKVAFNNTETKLRTNKCTPVIIAPYTSEDQVVEFSGIDDFIEEAYSCVRATGFKYQVGIDIEIKDFDPHMDDVCVPGIHFHYNLEECFEWHRVNAIEIHNTEDLEEADILTYGLHKKYKPEGEGYYQAQEELVELIEGQEVPELGYQKIKEI